MKICVLAWGSLQWDPRPLQISSDFEPNGPILPIEFSRISGRGGRVLRLTLVIDEDNGSPCRTYTAASRLRDLERAKDDLRARERMPNVKGVGFVDRRTGKVGCRAMKRHPNAIDTILAWLGETAFDAAIWTALESNFAKDQSEPFSVPAALTFLESLPAENQVKALEYINLAPPLTQTPVRRAVAKRWPSPARRE